MLQDLLLVTLFENQICHMLELQDYEYHCGDRDPEVQVPPLLSETYRRRVIQSRGVPAVGELTEWSVQTLGNKLPKESLVQLHVAHEALRRGSESAAYDALELAALSMVSELTYWDLSLREVAASTCLVSKLTAIADHVVAGMSSDLVARTAVTTPGDEVWNLVSGEGELTGLVDLLVRFFDLHRKVLPDLMMTTVEHLREQIVPSRQDGDLPGFVVALWAATNGHLITLGDEILAGLAARAAAYELRRPLIEKELGLH